MIFPKEPTSVNLITDITGSNFVMTVIRFFLNLKQLFRSVLFTFAAFDLDDFLLRGNHYYANA